jgi:imidazolonepropionase-like amidohydrolase
LELPAGVVRYDVGSYPVTPGITSAWHVNSATGAPFAKDSDAAQQFAGDGFDPLRPAIKRMVKSGVTAVHLVNQPINVVAGQTTWKRLDPRGAADLAQRQGSRTVAAEQWALTEAARSVERYPASLVGQVAMVRERLRGGEIATTLYLPDSALQKLLQSRRAQQQAIRDGQLPVLIAATRDGEIEAALKTVSGSGARVWLYGPAQLQPFVNRLAEQKVGVIAPVVVEDQYDWYMDDLWAAQQAGVPVLLAGDSGWALRATAAGLVARGMEPEAGLRMLMIEPGKVFEPLTPSGLNVGAPADLLIWSGHPLDLTSRILWNALDH